MGLAEYKRKRDFNRTAEPAGRVAANDNKALSFVIQKHAARRLHYDFRLEMDGVLKSWAVPKGIPTAKGDKRLAIHVEDHPMDYAGFEGTIPEGNYGAGTVMVWDMGTYRVSGDPVEGLRSGKLHLWLTGKKLRGEWTLVRLKSRHSEEKEQWLLFKTGADVRGITARQDDLSALTKRTMRQITEQNTAQWQSNRHSSPPAAALPKTRRGKTPRRRESRNDDNAGEDPKELKQLKGLPKAAPRYIEPMKCRLVSELPAGGEWVYEIKFDGIRALSVKNGDRVTIYSRNHLDRTAKYPAIASAIAAMPCSTAVLDGEVVALEASGRSSFQLLQSSETAQEIFYYVFDLLQLNGKDLASLPLTDRKNMLEELLEKSPGLLRYSACIRGDPKKVVAKMKGYGLEGLIGKRASSVYEPGRRSGAWVKLKWTNEQEFVIGGYTPPQGSRKLFGAILVGFYENGKLMFSSKVGTGFNEELLGQLYNRFQEIRTDKCPFANLPSKGNTHGLTAGQMKRCTWVKPELVCQIRFTEWTRDGHLRHPVFLGLRDDKAAAEVKRERAEEM